MRQPIERIEQASTEVEQLLEGVEVDLAAVSARIFPGLIRESRPLYDFVDAKGVRYEIKKQRNLQWFDLSKYHDLSRSERDIRLLVVLLDGTTQIDKIFVALLGQFVDKMCEINPDWSVDMRRLAYQFRQSLKTTQIKSPVYLRRMASEYPGLFRAIYQRTQI